VGGATIHQSFGEITTICQSCLRATSLARKRTTQKKQSIRRKRTGEGSELGKILLLSEYSRKLFSEGGPRNTASLRREN